MKKNGLSDAELMAWSRAASAHYAKANKTHTSFGFDLSDITNNSNGLTHKDVEFACDVSSLMPILYLIPRFLFGPFGENRNNTYIEIGTADGSSALPMLKALEEISGHLHSVDPADCHDAHRLVDTFGYRKNWTHHKMTSDDFFVNFNQTIDFAFIDGEHAWPVVERDIANCYNLLRPGGIVWVSDYSPLFSGFASYEHEAIGGPARIGDIFIDHPRYDQQISNGVSKAIHHILPRLEDYQALHLPIWPNPSVLIRKKHKDELL